MTWILRIITLVVIALPEIGLAQGTEGFVPLIGIPGLPADTATTQDYINILYVLAISIGAFLAVVQIIFAGFTYMLSEVVPQKMAAQGRIRTALIGLLIIIGATVILQTINPQLTNLDALDFEAVSRPTPPRATAVFDIDGDVLPAGVQAFDNSSEARAAVTACGGELTTQSLSREVIRYIVTCPNN